MSYYIKNIRLSVFRSRTLCNTVINEIIEMSYSFYKVKDFSLLQKLKLHLSKIHHRFHVSEFWVLTLSQHLIHLNKDKVKIQLKLKVFTKDTTHSSA